MAKFNLDDYVQVHERIAAFREEHGTNGGIQTDVQFPTEETVLAKAIVTLGDKVIGMGHAEEKRGQGLVNTTSAVENAETSAVGRALAMVGYEVKRGIASREEMEKVQRLSPVSGQRTKPSVNEVFGSDEEASSEVSSVLANDLLDNGLKAWILSKAIDKKVGRTPSVISKTVSGLTTEQAREALRIAHTMIAKKAREKNG